MQNSLNLEGVEQQPLKEYTEKAYLDYSMYVILDVSSDYPPGKNQRNQHAQSATSSVNSIRTAIRLAMRRWC